MDRLFIVHNCEVCYEDELGVLLANQSINMGEKIIITDIKFHDPSNETINNIFDNEVHTPSMLLSNIGVIKNRFGVVFGKINELLKISTFDSLHTYSFIKAFKKLW